MSVILRLPVKTARHAAEIVNAATVIRKTIGAAGTGKNLKKRIAGLPDAEADELLGAIRSAWEVLRALSAAPLENQDHATQEG